MAGLMNWKPGRCATTFTHSKEPLILPSKTGASRALSSIIEDATPPCDLNPFLFNGHLQTFYTAAKDEGPSIHYKRRVFEQEDSNFKGHFGVDFVVKPDVNDDVKPNVASDGGTEDEGLREDPTGVGHRELPPRTTYWTDKEFEELGSNDEKPMLILLHGISGGSHEVYLRNLLVPLTEPTPEGKKAGLTDGDWDALVVNSRGCAGTKITTSMIYNARATWDTRQVVKWVRSRWPRRPLYGVGFSLGANILTNYMGEEGDESLLNAACVISAPFKLESVALALQRTWLGLNVYSKVMADSMRQLYTNHADMFKKNSALDPEKLAKIQYLHEFDREVQTHTWGYPSEGAYYRDASSADVIMNIRRPFLAIHAKDDPIACDEGVPYEEFRQNPYTVLLATSGGGHVSWFEFGQKRWFVKPVSPPPPSTCGYLPETILTIQRPPTSSTPCATLISKR
ncbi:AB-hydrolase YheT [Polychaeton citri CBS 116435]|uniref:AB-hydrolase YheT n=1 Tax=Polychaeton citri CBS 116435 TaxID=1314669 RepID=A0A9P4UM70_9PEZI|nr:AB-hydrolase YheT [Polychaeton citri CBS 116435]